MAVQRWTSRRRAAFLKALTDTGNVSAAARAARASRSRAYQLKAADPGFAAEWADALETATDALDAEARRRALEGVETPHFHQGRVAGTVRKYSDPLLMFLLRAHRPDRYRDRPAGGSDADADLDDNLAAARDTLAARLARLDEEPDPDGATEDPE